MTDLKAIGKASGSWWAWLRYLTRSRSIVQDLLGEIERADGLQDSLGVQISELKDDLEIERQKTANMAAVTDALDEALDDAEDSRKALLKTCAQRDALQERVDVLQANCDQNAKAQAECAAAQEWARQIESKALEASKSQHHAEARVALLESELAEARLKLARPISEKPSHNGNTAALEKRIREQDDAIRHLVQWIRTTHRTSTMPEVNTIKRLLFNAQHSNRQ